MGDYRSYRTIRLRGRRDAGPQRIADVLSEVLARYGTLELNAEPTEPSSPARLAVPTRQLALFDEASIGNTA